MMNPDICNIHPQIRIYVYALADPRRSAGSGWIWIRPCTASPRRRSAGSRFQDPQMAEPTTFGRKILLISCLSTPIWDGAKLRIRTLHCSPLGVQRGVHSTMESEKM